MSVDNYVHKKVVSYLKHLGFDTEQARVYIFLLENGSSSVLDISRGLRTGRTKLYPLLTYLAEKQLVTINERHYGTSYTASAPEVLEFLVVENEGYAESLRNKLPSALSALNSIAKETPNKTKVIEYRGLDGLKQMNFNLSNASKEFRVLELSELGKHLGARFANKMRERYYKKGLTSYDLTNNPNRKQSPGVDSPHAHARYISPEVFTIEFETYIYDNVVGLLSYNDDNILGIEIHSDKFARQHTQIFDMLWKQGKNLV